MKRTSRALSTCSLRPATPGSRAFVYAASRSTCGYPPGLPRVEEVIGTLLSPYAVTQYANEFYADVFARCYGLTSIGLRYFNIFGPRQDPVGGYAAVIPKWIRPVHRQRAGVHKR